jgi:hypothetical protein
VSLGLCDPAIAAGQQFRGAVLGTVTDPAGALVPEARVTLTGIATNTTIATRTNVDGFYVIEYIPPGRYRLRVEASGFQPVTLEAVEVRIGDRLTLDHQLAIGPYTLEGQDPEWKEVVNDRRVHYSNLPHGRYRFRV